MQAPDLGGLNVAYWVCPYNSPWDREILSLFNKIFYYTIVSTEKYLPAIYIWVFSFTPSEFCLAFFFPLKLSIDKADITRQFNFPATGTKFPTHFGKLHRLNLEGVTFSANIPLVNVNDSFSWAQAMMPASCAGAGEVRETADLTSFLPASNISTMAHYSSAYLWAAVYWPLQYQAILALNLDFRTSSSLLKWKKAISLLLKKHSYFESSFSYLADDRQYSDSELLKTSGFVQIFAYNKIS